MRGAYTEFIIRWKVGGALQSPKGIQRYSNNFPRARKAVFWMSLGSIGISWNPANRSILLKYLAFYSWSRRSSIWGKGYASFSVTVLSFLKSTTSLHPSFFGTISIGLAQGLLEGKMTPAQGIQSHQTERIPTTKGQKLTQSKTMSRVIVRNTVIWICIQPRLNMEK